MANVTLKDLGYDRIMAELNEAKKLEVAIGIQQGSQNNKGEDLVSIAAANEYGTDIIPSRPFMATTFENNRKFVEDAMRKGIVDIQTGKRTPYVVLGRIGQRYQEKTKQTIASWTQPPNAPRTIAKKGRDEPLRDTYSMMKNVRWVVRKKGTN